MPAITVYRTKAFPNPMTNLLIHLQPIPAEPIPASGRSGPAPRWMSSDWESLGADFALASRATDSGVILGPPARFG
jgi:hypothetical protein